MLRSFGTSTEAPAPAVLSCYVSLAPPPRHQHPWCFHLEQGRHDIKHMLCAIILVLWLIPQNMSHANIYYSTYEL